MDMLNTFFESSESTDIFLMEAVSRSNYTERMAEIEFMESGDAEVFTESVVDSVKDFIRKITDKVKEVISNLKKKIAEKIADAKLKKAIKDFRKINANDLQKLAGKKYKYADWKKIDKKMYGLIKDYKAAVNKVSSMKCETGDDARKIIEYIDSANELLASKYYDGSVDDFMVQASVAQIAQDDAQKNFTKYMDALDKLDEEAAEAERKAAEELEKQIAKQKADEEEKKKQVREAISSKLSAIKKLASTRLRAVSEYAKLLTGMAGGCFGAVYGIYNMAGTANVMKSGIMSGDRTADKIVYGSRLATGAVITGSSLYGMKKTADNFKKYKNENK